MANPSTQSSGFYQPLDRSRRQIRLIEIEELNPTAFLHRRKQKLSCRLKTVSLDDNPKFTALSYVWGPPLWLDDIVVNGTPAKVTMHLADALRYVKGVWLREFPGRDAASFSLWADALCINQSDPEEKKHQVGQMGTIYGSAELVIGWLPEMLYRKRSVWEAAMKYNIGDIRALDDRMEQIVGRKLDLAELPRMVDSHPGLNNASAASANTLPRIWRPSWLTWDRDRGLSIFCTGDYWRRVWITQEVVLSRRLVVATPLDSIAFESIARVMMWKANLSPEWKKESMIDGFLAYPLKHFDNVRRLAELRATKMSGRDFRGLLLQAARISALAKAADPRDSIYGLLGLTQLSIVADYEKEYRDVLTEFFQKTMQAWRSEPSSPSTTRVPQLTLLAYAGTSEPHQNGELPSWIPNFRATMGIFSGIGSRADNSPEWRAGVDIAIGSSPAPAIRGSSLWTTGIILGKVQYLTRTSIGMEMSVPYFERKRGLPTTNVYRQLYLKAMQSYLPARTGLPGLRAFFRVFVSWQHWSRDFWVEMQLAFWFAQLIEPMTPEMFTDDFLLPREKKDMDQWPEQYEVPFWNPKTRGYDQQVIIREKSLHWDDWGLFKTPQGYLGRCPVDTVIKDRDDPKSYEDGHDEYLAVVCGYEAPVMLRKIKEHYILVSSCCVPGLMQGEAKSLLRSGEYQLASLEIQ